MLDLRWIREAPERLDAALDKRGMPAQSAEILALDADRRKCATALQEMQNRRNTASKEIGQAMSQGDADRADALKSEVAKLKTDVQEAESRERTLTEQLDAVLATIPNVPADDVPVGPDEEANVEVRRVGEPPSFDFEPKMHDELGEALGMMDFERAAHMSGARFVVLRGALARLERALAQFMLDLHTGENGYTEVVPPFMVRDNAMFGTGQLPKFAADLFHTDTGHWLIPTSEVPLTYMVADRIVDADELPMRMTAYTPCFRSEAGAAGRDTRGMIRQHQFTKVELVSVTRPDQSWDELERMTACAEEVLKRLDLAYRVVILSTGDMGFGAAKTYDIEVWLPGQGTYREISSCSNCLDFQARRMKARFRAAGEKGTQFVHSLNGSGLAVGRTLIAVLENYQQPDGEITVPDVLRPYMGGMETIG